MFERIVFKVLIVTKYFDYGRLTVLFFIYLFIGMFLSDVLYFLFISVRLIGNPFSLGNTHHIWKGENKMTNSTILIRKYFVK